jgi:hypothetical protein
MECPKCKTNNPDTQRHCGACGTRLDTPDGYSDPVTKTLETPKEELRRKARIDTRLYQTC